MFEVPTPDADERRDNATFAAVLEALARPGTLRVMPEAGMMAVARALIDRECRVACDDPFREALAGLGATLVPPELADHALISVAEACGVDRFARLPCGEALYPERGATAIVSARIGEGARLRLTGPGVNGAAEVQIGGVDAGLWPARVAACRYPLGVDLLFVDSERLLGLPRSTNVEVL